jgi:hypothetical protein
VQKEGLLAEIEIRIDVCARQLAELFPIKEHVNLLFFTLMVHYNQIDSTNRKRDEASMLVGAV